MKFRPILALALLASIPLQSVLGDEPLLEKAPFLKIPYPLKYPDSLQEFHAPGNVYMILNVDERGHVTGVKILGATHPDFVPATLQATRKWVFEPVVKNGAPQSVRIEYGAFFEMRNRYGGDGGDYRFGFNLLPSTPKAQNNAFDTLPDVLSAVNPIYPYELALAGKKVLAEVIYNVDESGTVVSMEVVSSTQPELTQALQAMGEACHFGKAWKNNRSVGYQLHRRQDFGPWEKFISFDHQTKQLVEQLRSGGTGLVSLADLDAKPRPLYQPGPVYPRSMRAAKTTGSAEIEFFIDPEGRAQLPRIVAASQPEFGWAAATAIQQWFFEVPKQHGKPVFVRLRISMEFNLPPQT
jgi:TonB family protein